MENCKIVERPEPSTSRATTLESPGNRDIHAARLARHFSWVRERMLLRFGERGVDPADIEDSVADVFVALLQRSSFVDDRAWLIAAASNRCRSLCRDRARKHQVESDAIDTVPCACELEPSDEPSLECVARAVGRLDELQREVVLAHYWRGVALTEIARRSGATRRRVRWVLERALLRLRLELRATSLESV